jgi:mono/diheme cytochrome c family protein
MLLGCLSAAESGGPSGDLRADASRGRELYALYCSVCHGSGGAGDGPTASWMFPRPTNHTDHDYMASLSDEYLYRVIQKGGPSVGKSSWMAAWGPALSNQEIRDLIAHIRALSRT